MAERAPFVTDWLVSAAKLRSCTVEEAIENLLHSAYDECLSLYPLLSKKRQVPPLWIQWVEALRALKEREQKAHEEHEQEREIRRDKYLNSKLKRIDFSVLAKATTLRSGYEGIYPHRNGWRGFVTDTKGKGRHLRMRATPELAAWDRYLWHKANDVPYGDSAKAVAGLLRGPAAGTDPEVIATEQEALERWNRGEIGATDSHLVWAERQARKALREAEAAKPKMGRPLKRKEVYAEQGGIVTWIDQWRVVVEHEDGTATSYQGIGDVAVGKLDRIEGGILLGHAVGARTKIRVTNVPPPSKVMEKEKGITPQVHFAPTSPNYVPIAKPKLAEQEPESVHETLAVVEETLAAVEALPEPEPDHVPRLEVAEPTPAPAASIFDPGYKPAMPAPGRFAHIKSKPLPPEQLAAQVTETLAKLDEDS